MLSVIIVTDRNPLEQTEDLLYVPSGAKLAIWV